MVVIQYAIIPCSESCHCNRDKCCTGPHWARSQPDCEACECQDNAVPSQSWSPWPYPYPQPPTHTKSIDQRIQGIFEEDTCTNNYQKKFYFNLV